MESTCPQEDNLIDSNDSDQTHIVKGKRTKRQRLTLHPQLLPAAAVTSWSSRAGDDRGCSSEISTIQSPTASSHSMEEDHDMANCLILLAQGGSPGQPEEGTVAAHVDASVRKLAEAEAAAAVTAEGGFYVFECKTCNRCFLSFQALGGHRASHKKLKATEETDRRNNGEDKSLVVNNSTQVKTFPHRKSRVHECSICGSGFSSGQALGGHMRRHRTAIAKAQESPRKERNMLSLDLNLPAPDEDYEFPESQSQSSSGYAAFSGKSPLLFSASALVDCHY